MPKSKKRRKQPMTNAQRANSRYRSGPEGYPHSPLGRGTNDGSDRAGYQSAQRHKIDAANKYAVERALLRSAGIRAARGQGR